MSSALPKVLRSWLTCRKCRDLTRWRRNVVIGMGDIPARLLLIGEGPGKSEDVLGEPFIGRSGKILWQGLMDAAKLARKPLPTIYVTNLIACRPTDEYLGDNRAPRQEEVARCMPRLSKIVALVRPERVIFFGDVAMKEGRRLCPDGVKVRHPAFVARKGGVGSTHYRIFVRGIVDVLKSLD